MDQFLTRERAKAEINRALKLKEKIGARLIDKKIAPQVFMRMTGRVNNYIHERLPYLI